MPPILYVFACQAMSRWNTFTCEDSWQSEHLAIGAFGPLSIWFCLDGVKGDWEHKSSEKTNYMEVGQYDTWPPLQHTQTHTQAHTQAQWTWSEKVLNCRVLVSVWVRAFLILLLINYSTPKRQGRMIQMESEKILSLYIFAAGLLWPNKLTMTILLRKFEKNAISQIQLCSLCV